MYYPGKGAWTIIERSEVRKDLVRSCSRNGHVSRGRRNLGMQISPLKTVELPDYIDEFPHRHAADKLSLTIACYYCDCVCARWIGVAAV